MTLPYRDDLESVHARIELLERAVHDRVCQDCAARAIRRRRRSFPRIALAALLGSVLLAVLFGSYFSLVSPSRAHIFVRDVRP